MAKVYSFEEFQIRRKIKILEDELASQNKEGHQSSFLWFNHFTVMSLHKEIVELKERLGVLRNDVSFTKNEKDTDF